MKSTSPSASVSDLCKTNWNCQLSSQHMYFHMTKNMFENYNWCNKKAESCTWDAVESRLGMGEWKHEPQDLNPTI